MKDPRPTDYYENIITERLRVTPTWADVAHDDDAAILELIHAETPVIVAEAISLMATKIRRLENERAPRHETELAVITTAHTRPQIAEAARLVAQLIITQEVSAPEGRAILYALQLSLSALKLTDATPRRRTLTRKRRRKARDPRPARTRPRRQQKSTPRRKPARRPG